MATNIDNTETGQDDDKLVQYIPVETFRLMEDNPEGASVTSPPLVKRTTPKLSRPPSDDLIYVLGDVGKVYGKPKRRVNKLDLSYVSPMLATINKGRNLQKLKIRKETERKRRDIEEAKGVIPPRTFENRLPDFLARYIELSHDFLDADFTQDSTQDQHLATSFLFAGNPESMASKIIDLNAPFSTAFNDEKMTWLSRVGYDITDLVTWEWILTAESSEKAARRLAMVVNRSDSRILAAEPVPAFILLFLLRRRDCNSSSLRLLLEHAWDRLKYQRPGRFTEFSGNAAPTRYVYKEMSEPTIMVMIVRFLRQARKVWPAVMVDISTMMTKYINGKPFSEGSSSEVPLEERISARMTFLYNRMLSLLALPSPLGPFKSMVYQQRAQFIILKCMNEFRPSLAVTREGYRAVTAVQLAHKKTEKERKWATLKAFSWPPWKEDKLGIDRDIRPEHGISRAGESLCRAREAGYPRRAWEDSAEVFAGWDTDHSPTIQTRTILPRGEFSRAVLKPGATGLWAARVRATRTVDESWACFLAYKSQHVHQPSQAVYHAMFERIVFQPTSIEPESLVDNKEYTNSPFVNPLPGDGLETFPIPSPPEAIYLRTPTPTKNQLFEMMIKDQIKPSGRLLGFLWKHAEDYNWGVKYLRKSSLSFSTINALLGQKVTQPDKARAELELMEDHLFADFIYFLSRVDLPDQSIDLTSDGNPEKVPLSAIFSRNARFKPPGSHTNPLLRAFQLMEIRKPYYRPPWNSLLSALAHPNKVVSSFQKRDHNVQCLLSWKAICYLLRQMQEIGLDIDFQGFLFLCLGLRKAILASRKLLQATETQAIEADRTESARSSNELEAERVLATGLKMVKKHFRRLVGTNSSSSYSTPRASELSRESDPANADTELPRLLEVPQPSHLHAFIRLLGICEDYIGLLDLVLWMSHYTFEIQAAVSEPLNGRSQFRLCVIAIRCVLERHRQFVGCEGADTEKGPDKHEEIFHQIIAIVEKNESWGGWPNDDEVMGYSNKLRRPRGTQHQETSL